MIGICPCNSHQQPTLNTNTNTNTNTPTKHPRNTISFPLRHHTLSPSLSFTLFIPLSFQPWYSPKKSRLHAAKPSWWRCVRVCTGGSEQGSGRWRGGCCTRAEGRCFSSRRVRVCQGCLWCWRLPLLAGRGLDEGQGNSPTEINNHHNHNNNNNNNHHNHNNPSQPREPGRQGPFRNI